jgi:hypothetical protein
MSTSKKLYQVSFAIQKETANQQNNNDNIPIDNIQIKENFDFFDFNTSATIGYLKEFFLTTFGQKYKFCKCVISLYYLDKKTCRILSRNESKKINELNEKKYKLFLIKTNNLCDCDYKMYTKYMNMNKFDIITNLKKLDEINIEYEKEIEELKKLESEKREKIQKLEEQLSKLKKEGESKVNDDSKSAQFYDIIIDINSIKNINKEGWKIIFGEKGEDKYKEHKDKELITIGVLGNNNKGKSFLLTKISQIDLPTGTNINTKGLSVKYPDLDEFSRREIILLDSAGLEMPVLKKDNNNNKIKKENENEIPKKNDNEIIESNDKKVEKNKECKPKNENEQQNKEFKENARDKIMTELFLENFIIEVSDILLIVVGKLTYSEQLLINKIKEESKKKNKATIFIIHNLQEFRTVEQVENYITKCLLNCSTFNLKKRKWISTEKDKNIKNRKEKEKEEEKKEEKEKEEEKEEKEEEKEEEKKVEKQDKIIEPNFQNKINENDEIIKDKNIQKEKKKNINNIDEDIKEGEESKLNDIHFNEIINYGDNKKISVYHLIIANEDSEAGKIYNQYAYDFLKYVYNLISEPKKFDVLKQVKEKFKNLSHTFIKDDISNNQFIENDKKLIKLDFEGDLSLKKCFTDELGFSFFKTGDFEPKYNYFKPDNKTLEIRIEIPGNKKCNVFHKILGDEIIITIKGQKLKDNTPEKEEDVLFNIREFSEFELDIPLKVQDFDIKQTKPKEGYPKYVNGVCCIQYELADQAEGVFSEEGGL